MTLELLNFVSEPVKDFPDVDSRLTEMALKLNELVFAFNKAASEDEGEDPFIKDLLELIETWKEEAQELENHPENFIGFNKEVCSAIALDKIHCCSEIVKLLEAQNGNSY
jgi:hypothetical protein